MPKFKKPELLTPEHTYEEFNCLEESLNIWLKRYAVKNQQRGASRCFVLCEVDSYQVDAYYTLSAGAIAHVDAPKKMRRNMPNPLPVLLIGRLAIDQSYQNQGFGTALLQDAMHRALSVANEAGVFAVMVHALSEQAKRFYLSRGFVESPIQPMTLMMTLKTIKELL